MLAVKCVCAFDNLLNLSCEVKRNDPHINEANMMIRVGHVTRVGEGRDAARVLTGKPEVWTPRRRCRHRNGVTLKLIFKK